MNNKAIEVYTWDESKKNILKEHQKYLKDMITYIEQLRKEGLMVFPPKKPTSKLPNLFSAMCNNNPNSLVGEDLHEYLKQKISEDDYKEPEKPEEKLLKV